MAMSHGLTFQGHRWQVLQEDKWRGVMVLELVLRACGCAMEWGQFLSIVEFVWELVNRKQRSIVHIGLDWSDNGIKPGSKVLETLL